MACPAASGGFGLAVRLRGRDDVLSTQGWCVQKALHELFCRGFPGGGRINASPATDDGGSVRISLRRRATAMLYLDDRIQMSAVGQPEWQWLSRGKDDDVFRLDLLNAGACRDTQPARTP
jgi:hypothetical protein